MTQTLSTKDQILANAADAVQAELRARSNRIGRAKRYQAEARAAVALIEALCAGSVR